jgi:hypothetical protein
MKSTSSSTRVLRGSRDDAGPGDEGALLGIDPFSTGLRAQGGTGT